MSNELSRADVVRLTGWDEADLALSTDFRLCPTVEECAEAVGWIEETGCADGKGGFTNVPSNPELVGDEPGPSSVAIEFRHFRSAADLKRGVEAGTGFILLDMRDAKMRRFVGVPSTPWLADQARKLRKKSVGREGCFDFPSESMRFLRRAVEMPKIGELAATLSGAEETSGLTVPTEAIANSGVDSFPVEIKFSPDYCCLSVGGKEYTFTPTQAPAVRELIQAWQSGTPELSHKTLLDAMDVPSTSRLRDIFRTSDAWGTLIIPGTKRGSRRIQIPPSR